MSTSTTPPRTTASSPKRSWSAVALRWTRPAIIANLVGQIIIVGTGGAVRLTGSGLGCSTWPMCEPGEFTPSLHDASSIHPFIEFGNRTLTGVLGVLAIAVALLVWTNRSRSLSYRLLGLTPLLGVVAQAVIGGITVLVDLHPAIVGGHLLISMALVAVSAILLDRSAEGDAPPVSLVAPRTRVATWLLEIALVPVLVLGVVVTGAGPHSGDSEDGYRFAFDPAHVTKFHAGFVWLFIALLAVLTVLVWRTQPPLTKARRVIALLAVLTLAQGAIGYVQYFTGLPEILVGLHMLGAATLTAGAARVPLALRTRADVDLSGKDATRA
ncbi:COX15/CtaA family protein [Sanguibacter gelidistatuariae]|uniref:COX15/CtaA family protein n=1 Tax=Sanguibacter gelidistatuariae TaxID=1814289 RepID=UPI000AD9A4F9